MYLINLSHYWGARTEFKVSFKKIGKDSNENIYASEASPAIQPVAEKAVNRIIYEMNSIR